MALDLSALSAYTDEQKFQLITKSVLGAKTIKMMSIQSGIKSASKINIIDTDAVFQAGGTCGFNASGTTTLSQRTLTVGKIKVHEAICPKDLEAKYLQTQIAAGSQYDTLQFAEIYLNKKSAKISEAMEKAVWQGSLISGDAQLNKFDGIIKVNDDSGSNIVGNVDGITTAVGITKTNANAILQGIYSKIPVEILDKTDTKIFVGWDTFRKWTMNLTTLNLFHYNANAGVNGELVLPGTNIMVVAVNGLNTINRMFAMQTLNLYFGTDMENEEEKYEFFFAKEADQMRYMVEWKSGVQVAFPDQVVEFTLV